MFLYPLFYTQKITPIQKLYRFNEILSFLLSINKPYAAPVIYLAEIKNE